MLQQNVNINGRVMLDQRNSAVAVDEQWRTYTTRTMDTKNSTT